ncbi:hypothetical protein [Mumia sp. Pv 4-285]|uniref:hypothetical protein n=1 Tax=Mumia qirimensis TaxID=3234852 RepID=UPI00351CF6D5
MKRFVAVTAVALAVPALVGVPSAEAATAASARASSGVLWDDCFDHRFSYTVGSAAASADDWELDVTLVGPDGRTADSNWLWKGGDPASGSSSFFFCGGSDRPGTYQIRGTVTSYDEDYNATKRAIPTSTFRMRQPQTRSAVRATPKKTRTGRVVRLKGTSKVERPRGFYALEYAPVRLQQKVHGKWRNVKASQYTDHAGRASFRYRAKEKGTLTFRLYTPASSTQTASLSKAVKVRVRS